MSQATNSEESSTVEHVSKCPNKLDNANLTVILLRNAMVMPEIMYISIISFFFPFIATYVTF